MIDAQMTPNNSAIENSDDAASFMSDQTMYSNSSQASIVSHLSMNECKFNDCQHINEPKCAVLAALEAGEIYAERYANYLSMYEDEVDDSSGY